jgi:hypothetical protein
MLIAGEEGEARGRLRETADLYKRSWEEAAPRSFGRLIGMIKAAVLAGGGGEEAAYVLQELGDEPETPVAAYALAIAALVDGDDSLAGRSADVMREGSDPLERAAEAVAALADGDRARYAAAIGAIVADFEGRDEHVTGVAIADTALVLERIAARRGIASGVTSPLLPG